MASGRVRFEALDDTPASQGVLGGVGLSLALAAVMVGATYLAENQLAAEKAATALVQPLGLIWVVLFGCIWMAWRRQATVLSVVLLLMWLLISVAGNAWIAGWLQSRLESTYEDVMPLEMDQGELDVVVLLGGGTTTGPEERSQLGASGDRLFLAARLYHAGLAPRIICTGESLNPNTETSPAAQTMKLLTQVGVPPDAMIPLGGRNTSEEIDAIKRWSETEWREEQEQGTSKPTAPKRDEMEGVENARDVANREEAAANGAESSPEIGVITSAWHMPRVAALAKKQSLEITPLPCDFRARDDWSVRGMIPSGAAVEDVGKITKEILGRLLNR